MFRVAVGFRDQLVQVWKLECTLEGESTLSCLYSVRLEDTIPKALTFYGPSNSLLEARKLCVLGYLDGKL